MVISLDLDSLVMNPEITSLRWYDLVLIGEQVIYLFSDLLLLEREKVKIGSSNLGLSLIQTMFSVDVEPLLKLIDVFFFY